MPDKANYKQLNYIKSLLEQKDLTFEQATNGAEIDTETVSCPNDLTVKQASSLIDWLTEQEDA